MFAQQGETRCPQEPGENDQDGHNGSRAKKPAGLALTGRLVARAEGRKHDGTRKGKCQQGYDHAYGETLVMEVPP